MLSYPAMKQTLLCLALALLAAPIVQAVAPITVRFARVAQNGTPLYDPFVCADGSTLASGEQIALLFVVPEAGATLSDETPPFSFSADGAIHPAEGVARVVWAAVGSANTSPVHGDLAGDAASETAGIMRGAWGAEEGGLLEAISAVCHWPKEAGEYPGSSVSLWMVAFDTRAADPATGEMTVAASDTTAPNGPAGIAAWGAVQCYKGNPGEATGPVVYANVSEAGKAVCAAMRYDYFTRPALDRTLAPITTLVVAGETLTDPAAIEAALKPAISGLTVADDALSLTLTPPAAGPAATYTLYTATDLGGDWKPLDTLLQEKGLANPGTFRYTMWRISKENQVELPRFPGESARFYRLRCDTANDASPAEKR